MLYQSPNDDFLNTMFQVMGFAMVGAFAVAITRDLIEETSPDEKQKLLPAVTTVAGSGSEEEKETHKAIEKILKDIYKWRRAATPEEINWLYRVYPKAVTGRIGLQIDRLKDKRTSGIAATTLLRRLVDTQNLLPAVKPDSPIEQILGRYRGEGWNEIGLLLPRERQQIQDLVLTYEPDELMRAGFMMRVATRAYTVREGQFIRGRDGTAYSHFKVEWQKTDWPLHGDESIPSFRISMRFRIWRYGPDEKSLPDEHELWAKILRDIEKELPLTHPTLLIEAKDAEISPRETQLLFAHLQWAEERKKILEKWWEEHKEEAEETEEEEEAEEEQNED